ncbi:AraC family transcriptional regulator [Jannaschia seohaensis]|uniref:AraC-like DNA-binding protein n=1 Tax=Jannaschia seohaensis TaxID=475081 RepID=A0A2Y9C3D1_9RHOB|nr:AraC family transcriptional regulator [Jannaschia seohaensis]PWJ11736.1 AraC-like DNA-binding protein [Jannaschia seohaensis]SSA51252.1 AraC-type DNA-binding protein [Jannaschia seohaensis]
MHLDLELVHIRDGESFAAWRHGYPFRTVRWHYHPEYEIHLVVATHGKFYIGDHVGEFSPGQLIMTGPNLPQNWISDIGDAETVPRRTEVIQFPQSFADKILDAFPEAAAAEAIFERSKRGILFDYETGESVRPLMHRLVDARGVMRLALFFEILDKLLNASKTQTLSSLNFMLSMEKAEESDMNRVIAHLRENLTEPVTESELAEMTGQSQSAFSRSFKRHTGETLVRFRNQLRIDLACQMLIADPEAKVSDICFDVGFSNLSNFNRHFLRLKGMSPSEFRQTFAENEAVLMPA